MPTTGQNLSDKTLAFDLLKDSKFGITGMARLATEAANPGLRSLLNENLDQVVQEHFQLSDILIRKGWYQPTNIQQQLQDDLARAQQFTAQSVQG